MRRFPHCTAPEILHFIAYFILSIQSRHFRCYAGFSRLPQTHAEMPFRTRRKSRSLRPIATSGASQPRGQQLLKKFDCRSLITTEAIFEIAMDCAARSGQPARSDMPPSARANRYLIRPRDDFRFIAALRVNRHCLLPPISLSVRYFVIGHRMTFTIRTVPALKQKRSAREYHGIFAQSSHEPHTHLRRQRYHYRMHAPPPQSSRHDCTPSKPRRLPQPSRATCYR
jgi:hypothetical protein